MTNDIELFAMLRSLPVVDTHEHFHLPQDLHGYDAVQFLYFNSYCNTMANYLPRGFIQRIERGEGTLEDRYEALCQIERRIRYSGSGRLLRGIAAQWGVDTFDCSALQTICGAYEARKERIPTVPQMQATICNSVGHPLYGYVRGLRVYLEEKMPSPTGYFVNPLITGLHAIVTCEEVLDIAFAAGMEITSLAALEQAVGQILSACVKQGAVGFKDVYLYFRPYEIGEPDFCAAKADFSNILKGGVTTGALRDYMFYRVYALAEQLGLPMAVHTGCIISTCEPANHLRSLLPVIRAFPKLSFDLYHLNYPVLDDYMVLLKSFPNVYANCAWIGGMEPEYSKRFFLQALHSVSQERVLAFGGDMHCAGEPVRVAYENLVACLTRTLGESIDDGLIRKSDAEEIGKLWLAGNATSLYRLAQRRAFAYRIPKDTFVKGEKTMNAYIQRVLDEIRKKNATEPEFLQTVEEVYTSLEAVVGKHPEYEQLSLLERMAEPERAVSFRVSWVDDAGRVQVNRGYRVQFNGAIGPYKGGLRFHPSVNLSIMKFLGFEQTFKNSLTSLPIGGAKGGSDFDPRGKSDGEVMRFCQAYMTELYRHIGPDIDVPAGDIGVGAREIGYLYGQYRRIKGAFENGVLTGKGMSYGGSLIRPEATGFGAVYYANEVFAHEGDTISGKTFVLSGFGNVTWGVAKKLEELGAVAIAISGPDGYVHDPKGVLGKKIDYLVEMRNSGRDKVKDYADRYGCAFYPGEKPWGVKADVYMPCATQNDVNMLSAKKIAASGSKYYIEVANMPTTNDALNFLLEQKHLIVAPSKAVNAGGVATSALEMSQNSMRYSWSAEEVDAKLHGIMKNIHDSSARAAEENGLGYNLVAGANIAGFAKVADAMIAQGII